MRLTELNPEFVGSGGEGVTRNGVPLPRREGVALNFDCPCGCGTGPICIMFKNPLDGKPADDYGLPSWNRTGEDFETLTLTPSIQRRCRCDWHGFITNGEVTNA
jgi:hypothetical protein